MLEKPRKLRVFLCHTSADKPKVLKLSQRLTMEHWIDSWLDEEKILPGQHWTSVIKQSLVEADSVIILISNNSIMKEGFVQREMNYAWDMSLEKPRSVIYLIPLRLEDCEVPLDLKERQWADYFGEKEEKTYLDLLKSLRLRYKQKFGIEAEEFSLEEQQLLIELATREKIEMESAKKAQLKVEKHIRQQAAREKAVWEVSEKKKTVLPIEKPIGKVDIIKGILGFTVVTLLVLMIMFIYSGWHTQSLSSPPAKTPTLIPTRLSVSLFSTVENPMIVIQEFATRTSTKQATREDTPLPSITPTSTPKDTTTPVPPNFRPETYTLQNGEFPLCIARRFNVDPDALLQASGMTNLDLYYPGLILTIPQSGAFPGNRTLVSHPTTYRVISSDETLYSIACKYGDIDPGAIASSNGISTGSVLSVGQQIKIP